MGEVKLENDPEDHSESRPTPILKVVQDTHTDELIISICGFVGSDIDAIALKLKSVIEKEYGYECSIKKLSEYIKQNSKEKSLRTLPRYGQYQQMINDGNLLRKKHGASILVELAIQDIHYERQAGMVAANDKTFMSRKKCYIINSIKNKDELELLKLVYRDIHYCVGVFSSITTREANLKDEGVAESELRGLINRDSGEDIPHGQTVRDTFTLADFFIRVDSVSDEYLERCLARYLHLIFGSKVITPTNDETAMYMAASAAGNSACLSRQVGAALTDKDGQVISVGWNDVPKYNGDLYKNNPQDLDFKNDGRCVHLRKGCWNDKEKNVISEELVKLLIDEKIIPENQRDAARTKIRNSKIKGLVEFSRAIHAEMHALIIGSQIGGTKVRGGKMYITTYPCHICARHIIVAGIKEVYYIEPYRKSLTTKLHHDAITENETEKDKVIIKMFDGVAPSRYMHLFRMHDNSRKEDNGSGNSISTIKKTPKTTLSLQAIPVLEGEITSLLKRKGLAKN